MPRGDRTGPDGSGAMTGRRLGFCSGYESPSFTKCAAGFGRGMAFSDAAAVTVTEEVSAGRVDPAPYPAPAYTPEVRENKNGELRTLKDQARQMEEDLHALNARISELEK
ncbi:MAG: DUF5320 domain-containing protein [Candidatus Marinimicrobia bacterium]|nr:DUF5320 domain-containing protein [Candidatus Neomarinimicrobiota bacterium]